MVNNVIGVVNYVIAARPSLLNFVIADKRAAAASGEGLQPPSVDRFEELRALPVTVWIDGQHVRRIRFERGPQLRHRATLDLWEFGVPVGELNWSRLPTFRSPGYEQERRPWYQRVMRR
jgi:hypothetical protein